MAKCLKSTEDCKFKIIITETGDVKEECQVCLKTTLHKKEDIKDYHLLNDLLNNKN